MKLASLARLAAAVLLPAALVIPIAALAQGEGLETVDPEAADAAPSEPKELALEAIPTGEACEYPVQLLWHRESKDAAWLMGVSVTKKSSGQQVPGLNPSHFQVFLDGQPVPVDSKFEVKQSANAFTVPGEETSAGELGVDPVNYDVYFAVDMTASMSEVLEREGQKPSSKLNWALRVIHNLVQPARNQSSSLFDERDRVYISGFTSALETGFMTSTSADRDKIRRALATINEFQPSGDSAALYASILHNLSNIEAQGAEYSDPEKKREAVLIVLTDSFNGMDLEGRRALRYCAKNDPLTDEVQRAILKTQEATGGNLKLYLLAMGSEGEEQYYSLTEPPNRRCRINTVEKKTLDGRSFAALGNRELTRGGYVGSADPLVLLKFVKTQFIALKSAYEVSYDKGETKGRPRSFRVIVSIGDTVCQAEDLITSSIIPQAQSATLKHTAPEVALFLAGLIIAAFFVPRSLSNLVSLGGGSAPEPKRKKGKRRKKRR